MNNGSNTDETCTMDFDSFQQKKCKWSTIYEKCSTFLALRETQINTKMKDHFSPAGMSKIQELWWGCAERGAHSLTVGM